MNQTGNKENLLQHGNEREKETVALVQMFPLTCVLEAMCIHREREREKEREKERERERGIGSRASIMETVLIFR